MKSATCPYCEARFFYPEMKNHMTRRTGVCPHCGKKFCVSRRGFAVFLPCTAAALIALDFGLLMIPDMNLIFLSAVTVIGVVAAYLLLPFSVRFRRREEPAAAPGGKAASKISGESKKSDS